MLPDLVKRFSCTPFNATLALNNMRVRVETNRLLVLSRLQLESQSSNTVPEAPVVHWRIVVEDEVHLPSGNSLFVGAAHDGLAFIRIAYGDSLANGAFLAVDRQEHFGISFVATEFIEQEHLFAQHYFPALLLMLRETGDKI